MVECKRFIGIITKLYKTYQGLLWCQQANPEAEGLRWRHNERNGVSNHQPHDCLLNHLFRHRSKKTSKLRVTGLCVGNSPETGEFPSQRPVTLKMFPFDDVFMAGYQTRSWHWMWQGLITYIMMAHILWQWISPVFDNWAPYGYTDILSMFRDFHYKDKMVLRLSF